MSRTNPFQLVRISLGACPLLNSDTTCFRLKVEVSAHLRERLYILVVDEEAACSRDDFISFGNGLSKDAHGFVSESFHMLPMPPAVQPIH